MIQKDKIYIFLLPAGLHLLVFSCARESKFSKYSDSHSKIPDERPKYFTSRASPHFAAKVIGWFFSE